MLITFSCSTPCADAKLLKRSFNKQLPYHRILSPARPALFFSHVATATLLHHKTKTTQRYASPALIYWGMVSKNNGGVSALTHRQYRLRCRS